MKILANNLKLIREESLRVSQRKFAELLNSSRGKISSYENGRSEPSIAFMVKLQTLTNITIKDIFSAPLKIESISSTPNYTEKIETSPKVDEEGSYEQTENELNNYHIKLSFRLKNIEQQIKKIAQRLEKIEEEKEPRK